jgi:phage-related protein
MGVANRDPFLDFFQDGWAQELDAFPIESAEVVFVLPVIPDGVVRRTKTLPRDIDHRFEVLRPGVVPAPPDAGALAVLPSRVVSSSRTAHRRPSVFMPSMMIADAVVPPFGGAGADTFIVDAETGSKVTYTWATTVMKGKAGLEQRAQNLNRPRQRYDFTVTMEDSRARELLSMLASSSISAPVFLLGLPHEERTIISDATATTIEIDATAATLTDWAYPGQRIVIIAKDGTLASTHITLVTGGTLTVFNDVSAKAKAFARVLPAMQVHIDPNQSWARHVVNGSEWQLVAFAQRNGFAGGRFGIGATVNAYDGLSVLDGGVVGKAPGVQGKASQPLHSGTRLVDLGTSYGAAAAFDRADWGRVARLAGATGSIENQWLKKFLDTVHGGRVPFLMASGRVDLAHVGDASSGTLVITSPPTVGGVDYATDWFPSLAHRRLRLVRTDGVVGYRKISSAADNGNGTQNLTLDSGFAGALSQVQFLETVRLDEDSVGVTFSGPRFECAISARVVQR